ncbi:uncharacterized protein [Chiloscyllium punctatum]|uniref:uncharacterized protein isoform X2 n=1 Tax=Chiloscyllium punctatum TaxID=137246 RepID=UPI003B63C079
MNSLDTTQQFLNMFGTLEFESFDEFSCRLELFQQATGSIFKKSRTHTVKKANETRTIPIPGHFKYTSVNLQCVHYGQPRIRSTGVRPKQRYLAMGCEACITIHLDPNKNRLCVTAYHLIHSGHILDPDLLRHLGLSLERLAPDCRQHRTRQPMADGVSIVQQQPYPLTTEEKHSLLITRWKQLSRTMLQSDTKRFHRQLDWLDRQIQHWQQGMGEDIERLDENYGPSDVPLSWQDTPREIVEHSYARLHPSPDPAAVSQLGIFTSGVSKRSIATQTYAATWSPSHETAIQALLKLRDCQLPPIKQQGGPKGSCAEETFSRKRQCMTERPKGMYVDSVNVVIPAQSSVPGQQQGQ